MPLYLGFDCGTQSFNAVVLEVDGPQRRVVLERSLAFDETLPAYGTTSGVLPHPDPLVVEAPPLMWAEALDRMMELVAEDLGEDVGRIAAVTGSGQQHGSVWLNGAAGAVLAGLDPGLSLVSQLGGVFSRERAPVWMDSSTSAECAEITTAVGSPEALARLTGSRAFERFTGPQIRKLFKADPTAYARTHRIHLVSSWLATLLAGRHAPIDPGDGSGMNLMDLAGGSWAATALEATAPGLADKLPPLAPSATVFGRLSPYWMRRYGFPDAKLVVWTGDNPSSLVGVGAVTPGVTAISLGTSDTLFAPLSAPTPDPSGAAHVFGSPTGAFMSLVCFRNGSLAREHVRDAFGLDWDGFSAALRATPPGNRGALMLPWVEPEITPPVLRAGIRRSGLDADDAPANVRAVVEGQMLAMALHSSWATPRVERIHATGGAARNPEVLQVMADVFDAPVHRMQVANSACLGAGLRAVHADAASRGLATPWEEVVGGFADASPEPAAEPRDEAVRIYRDMRRAYAAFEARESGAGGRPSRA
jgi:xylulokinase